MSVSWFARLNHRYGPSVDLAERRRFIAATTAAMAAGLLSGGQISQASKLAQGRRIAVIGAGFGGLAAAFELASVGYDVTVLEARERLGGRVLSFNQQLGAAFIPGKNIEGGGELIGSNHPCWMHYADKFKLEFLDVSASEHEAPIVLSGQRLSAAESQALWEGMDEVFGRLNVDALPVNAQRPWEAKNAHSLDRRSVKDWLDEQTDLDPRTRRACELQISSDNGVEIASQSLLALLACIQGGGGERYWTESEVYRCRGGNQQLAHRLAEGIGLDRVHMNCPVRDVQVADDGVILNAADGRRFEADDVILTAPPAVWHRIAFQPPLPTALNPQMGANVKWLAHLQKRFWNDLNVAPDALTDSFMSQCWEGTDGQAGDENVSLNCFSGGDAARQSLALNSDARDAEYIRLLESIYPGFEQSFVGSRYMDWPRDAWTGAGYSFPAPGQVTSHGPVMHHGLGHLHFAGEHTCYAFVGYMEGGLNSGCSLARRIAARDGLTVDAP